MKKITVSAPGKLMLLGEHAVVYGRPCIVTAVGQRMKVTVELTDKPFFQLDAPDVQVINYKKPMADFVKGDIPKGAKFVEIAVRNFLISHPERLAKDLGVKVTTKSEFNSKFGFGSSSASTVCVIKALSELSGAKLSNKDIFKLSYKTVLDIQGKGSGFDIAAGVFGGTLYFVTGGKVIEPLNKSSLPLIVGYSGIKADTVTLINKVSEKAAREPEAVENIYNEIKRLVELGKEALLKEAFSTLGDLMNQNQALLSQLGVSIDKLDQMIQAALEAGAQGAKLSGAGGGDCMICLVSPQKAKAVKKAITQAGGQVINVKTGVKGVRIEK